MRVRASPDHIASAAIDFESYRVKQLLLAGADPNAKTPTFAEGADEIIRRVFTEKPRADELLDLLQKLRLRPGLLSGTQAESSVESGAESLTTRSTKESFLGRVWKVVWGNSGQLTNLEIDQRADIDPEKNLTGLISES
jgi:hypothetical protein